MTFPFGIDLHLPAIIKSNPQKKREKKIKKGKPRKKRKEPLMDKEWIDTNGSGNCRIGQRLLFHALFLSPNSLFLLIYIIYIYIHVEVKRKNLGPLDQPH